MFTPKPLDPSGVRIGARVRVVGNREGVGKAVGLHRVRIVFDDGREPAVILRGQVESIVSLAPGPKSSSRKAGPKALRLSPEAAVPALAEVLAGRDIPCGGGLWGGNNLPRARFDRSIHTMTSSRRRPWTS